MRATTALKSNHLSTSNNPDLKQEKSNIIPLPKQHKRCTETLISSLASTRAYLYRIKEDSLTDEEMDELIERQMGTERQMALATPTSLSDAICQLETAYESYLYWIDYKPEQLECEHDCHATELLLIRSTLTYLKSLRNAEAPLSTDTMVALWKEWKRIDDPEKELTSNHPEWPSYLAIKAALLSTPAQTIEGVFYQATWLLEMFDLDFEEPTTNEQKLMKNIYESLKGILKQESNG